NPHAGANLRNHERAHLFACDGHRRDGPGRWRDAAHVRHGGHDASDLHGIEVVDHRAAIDSAIFPGVAHRATEETDDPVPPRESVKFCLYWPRLMLCVTLFT